MTTQMYVLCAVAAFTGMLLHVFAIKIPSAKTRATAANIKFYVKDYFQSEWPAIAANIACIVIGLLIVGEAIKYKPEIQGYIITLSAFYGFTGSTLLLAIFGQVSKKINAVVDVKTNTADGSSAPTDTLKSIDPNQPVG